MKGTVVLLTPLMILLFFQGGHAETADEVRQSVSPQESGEWSLLLLYQNHLSAYDGARCLFAPTCSEFFRRAVDRYGILWGTLMTLERMLYREHRWALHAYPLSEDGERHVDPVYRNYILDAEAYYDDVR